MFGLSPDVIRNIKEKITLFPKIKKVTLYGSRAKGNYKSGSDIDITLMGKGLNLNNSVYPLIDELDDLYLPYTFDISIFNNIDNDDLIKNILADGKVFYEKENQLPKGWEIKKLVDVCEIQLGKTPHRKTERFWDKDKATSNVWISIADMVHGKTLTDSKEYISDLGAENIKIIPAKTLMLSFKLTLGRVSFSGIDLYSNEAIASLINLSDDISSKYLYYYFTFFDWNKEAEGDIKVKGKTLNKEKLKNINLIIPPPKEQQQIVALLDKAFTAIDQAKANAEQNLLNAKQLFESYLQNVFTNKGEDWEEKTLGEVCEYDKQKNIQNLPYIGLEHIEAHTGKFLGSKEPCQVKSSTFYFTKNHLLYGRLRPYLNKVLIPDFEGHCSTEIFPIKTNELIIREFLYFWFMSSSTVEKINSTWTGARMPRANMKEVINFKISIPSIKEQQKIVEKLDALQIQTKKLEAIYKQKTVDLEELKKSVLQKAFNGEL